jgi:RNA polymerase sigma-70 factor (ECF subfamily)
MASTQKELIELAKQGNKSALNTLLTESYPILKGYLIKMTGEIDIAQDIVQETMLKAVLNIKKFEPNAKFSTWLIAIGTNAYRDSLRKKKRLVELDEDMASSQLDVEEKVIEKIQYNEIKNILLDLPQEKRAVFILKHFYGYKYDEIAKIVNCPIGTVRSRLHNGIKQIITELERRNV